MNIMTKRGNLDNIVTYEHICDTYEDLQNIDPKYAALGSTAIIINQEEGLNAYMATSAGEWVPIGTASSGGGEGGGGITPTGTYNITANGTYNVTRYAAAKVNVPNEGINPSGTTYITSNGSYDVSVKAYAEVSIPLTTTTITQNGTYSGPANGGFSSVTVAVAELEPKLGQVIIPKDTVKTYEPEEMDFGSYKNITVTNSGIDTNSHITVTPNTKTQYIFGNDVIIIPQGTEKESETGVILYYNQPLTAPSCYRLHGEIHIINYNDNDEIVTQYVDTLDQDCVVPALVLNTSGNTIKLWKHYISISKPAVATITKIKVIVTKPIVFEKIANLTILDEIKLSDGSPNLSRDYQLDTNKINFNENSVYAVLGNTYNAGTANSDVVFFEPFKWNSTNGYRKKNYTEAQILSQTHFIISADYKLSVVDENIKNYGSVYICELDFTNVSNYLDYITINPIKTQTKTVTPSLTEQIIVPDTATPIITGDFSQTGMPTYNTPATTGYYVFPMDLSTINQGERYHVTGTIRYGRSGSQYTTEYTVDDDWTANTTKSIPLPTSLYDISLLWDSTGLTAIVPTNDNSTDRSISFGGNLSFIPKNNSYDGLSQVIVNPIPSNYVPKTNFTIYSSGLAGQGFYATANSGSNLNHYSTTNTPTSYWITGNELTLFISSTFDFTNDSTGVTLKSYDAQNGIAILTITDGAIIGVQTQPK